MAKFAMREKLIQNIEWMLSRGLTFARFKGNCPKGRCQCAESPMGYEIVLADIALAI